MTDGRVECLTQGTGAPRSRSNEPQDDGDGEHYPCYWLVFFCYVLIHPVSKCLPWDVQADDGYDAKQCEPDASHVLHKELLSEKGPPRFDPWGFQLLSASPCLRELPRSSRGHGSSRR